MTSHHPVTLADPIRFSISIFFIQAFTIFIPLHKLYKHQALRVETIAAISAWEIKNKAFGSITTESTKIGSQLPRSLKTFRKSQPCTAYSKTLYDQVPVRKTQMYQMLALEHALRWNPEPLQKFAALKDFSGENISFLTYLASWKKLWTKQDRTIKRLSFQSLGEQPAIDSDEQLRERYNTALQIYLVFVSREHAEFPINISGKTLSILDDIFAGPANLLYGDAASTVAGHNPATPFPDSPSHTQVDMESGLHRPDSKSSKGTMSQELIWYWGEIPEEFSAKIFEEAEDSIKYLVLTNTWPKFVNAGFAEQMSDDQSGTLRRRSARLLFWRQKPELDI